MNEIKLPGLKFGFFHEHSLPQPLREMADGTFRAAIYYPLPPEIDAFITSDKTEGIIRSWQPLFGAPSKSEFAYIQCTHRNLAKELAIGELIVHQSVAMDMASIMKKIFGFPIHQMRLIDYYDADDDRSMADNNSSALCVREITGGGKLSNHSFGTAIDLNPLLNPYCNSSTGCIAPKEGEFFLDRSLHFPGMIHPKDIVVETFTAMGWEWGAVCLPNKKDYQHFQILNPKGSPMTALFFAALCYYVNVPAADMRELPKQDAEIVSQGYFSEQINILEEEGDWIKIETVIDRYPGWVPKGQIHQKEAGFSATGKMITVNQPRAHLYKAKDTVYGPFLTLPFESRLEIIEENLDPNGRWIQVRLVDGTEGYIQRGDIKIDQTPLSREEMCLLSSKFLNTPYTWGGRSSLGYDCSGFVQMLYRQMNIHIPRDSKDQMAWTGFQAIEMSSLTRGDLIFFGLASDKIRHVGMYLGDGQFIHSTIAENKPYIHISHLADPEWNGSGRFVYRAARTLKK